MKQEIDIAITADYKITSDTISKSYSQAVVGAQKIIMLGIVGELAKLERESGTFMDWFKDNCDVPWGTISTARTAVKKTFEMIGINSPQTWALLLAMPKPELLFELDCSHCPRLNQIKSKLVEFCENKSARTLEIEVGVRKPKELPDPQRNGKTADDEISELVRKRNPKPTRQGEIRHAGMQKKRELPRQNKTVANLIFGAASDRSQSGALIGILYEIENRPWEEIAAATTEKQRESLAQRLLQLHDKLLGADVEPLKEQEND